MTFNPSAVATVGNEWTPWQRGVVSLLSDAQAVAARINSTVTETIDSMMIPFAMAGPNNAYGKLWADIYNVADLGVAETPTTTAFAVNQDVVINAMYTWNGSAAAGPITGTGSNITQYIDETTDDTFAPGPYDSVAGVAASSAKFAFATAGLAAGRVLSVSFEVRVLQNTSYVQPTVGQIDAPLSMNVELYNGANLVRRLGNIKPRVTYYSESSPRFETISFLLPTNPLTQEPWTRADVIDFDTGTGLMLNLSFGVGNGTVTVARVTMKVAMIAEKRVACGSMAKYNPILGGVGGGWITDNTCVLHTPAGVDNWAKASATNYLVVIRPIADPQYADPMTQTTINTLNSGRANPHNQGHAYTVTIDNTGRLLTASGPETRAFGVLMVTSAGPPGALSVDSQVYWRAYAGDIGLSGISRQFISNAGSATYQSVRAVVGIYSPPTPGFGDLPDAPLLFKIKRASDNVQMGGTATLNVADLEAQTFLGVSAPGSGTNPVRWFDVSLNLASNATLVSGTQYYIEVSSATTYPYWVLRWMEYTEAHSFTGDQSYGGSADYGEWASNGFAQRDMAMTITTAPPTAPATITITTGSITLPDEGSPICVPGVHTHAHVAWAATSEGGLFARYEVQRSNDGGTTWELIARVATESVVAFDDVEAPRAVALKYRVRTVRTNGQVSNYTTQSATSTFAINRQSVVFATNSAPLLTAGYLWIGPDHQYRFPSDEEVNVVAMHNRDDQVLFRPTEDRGVVQDLNVLIYVRGSQSPRTDGPPLGAGARAFGTVRAIVEANSPYVVVFTPDGERILAGLRLPMGRRVEPAAHYSATITAIQVARATAVTDV